MRMKNIISCFIASIAGFCALGGNVAYLSKNGNNDTARLNDEWKPFADLEKAIEALGDEGGEVLVSRGTYAFTSVSKPEMLQESIYTAGDSCIVITNPVSIVGATGNPEDVVFTRDETTLSEGRIFLLNHEGAKLKNVTVKNGYFKDEIRNGGNVLVGYDGGTVEDCILRDGDAGNYNNTNIGGGNIALMAGRCSRCIITGGTLSHYRPIGLNVMAAGTSIVENCLITKGRCKSKHEAAADEGAVALKDSARIINCTIVDNSANRFAGVNILSEKAQAINCVIFGNKVTYETDARGSTTDSSSNGVCKNNSNSKCYINCGTDLDTSVYKQLNDTSFSVCAADFIDAENGDWRAHSNGGLRDKGSDYASSGAISTVDLAGNMRVDGVCVDVGCYELQREFYLNGTIDKTTLIAGVDDIALFSVIPGDAVGAVTYTWDFGDGSDPITTTEASVAHQYSAVGVYSASVTAICESGSATYGFAPVTVLAFQFEIVRSADVTILQRAVTFRAVGSSPVPITFTWSFGDGTTLETLASEIDYTYETPGVYNVAVKIDGGSAGMHYYEFPKTLTVLPLDLYVKASGSEPRFPYGSWQTAAQNLNQVKDCLVDGITIHVGPGVYQTKDWQVVVTNAVRIVGEGDSPNDVVFHNGWANFNNGQRNMWVSNAVAFVANVTLEGGFASYVAGGNLLLNDGIVSNCVLVSGGSNSSGGSGGGVYMTGGLLTHCIITNSYLGNRGQGIAVHMKNGRVSNCLITHNRRSWSGSRNSLSLFYAEKGVVDNCTIANCWILKNNPGNPLQMGGKSDRAVYIGETARAYNIAIADIRWDIEPAVDEDRESLLASAGSPRRWDGNAGSFFNCVTDDLAPINGTCRAETTATMFSDYDGGNLMPGAALKNKGCEIEGCAFPMVDLAGAARIAGWAIDVGCYENQPPQGMTIFVR